MNSNGDKLWEKYDFNIIDHLISERVNLKRMNTKICFENRRGIFHYYRIQSYFLIIIKYIIDDTTNISNRNKPWLYLK